MLASIVALSALCKGVGYAAGALVAVAGARRYLWRRKMRATLNRQRGLHVVIIGASSGVGERLALEYAKRGARLVLVARRAERLAAVCAACTEAGALAAHAITADVTDPAQVLAMAETAVTEHLHGAVHCVALCAGVLTICPVSPTLEPTVRRNGGSDTDSGSNSHDDQVIQLTKHVFDVNAVATVHVARAFLARLRASAPSILGTPKLAPRLLVVTSVAGQLPAPARALYCASKAAAHSFLAALRIEERLRGSPVRIQELAPATIADTSLRATAADAHLWREGMPVGSNRGALDPAAVARAIVTQIDDVQVLPWGYNIAIAARALWPALIDFFAARKYRPRRPAQQAT